MGESKLFLSVFVLHLFSSAVVLSISIENNAYKGIYISSSGSWNDQNLFKLKEVLTKSSEYLYHATRNRSYFGEFVIADFWCNTSPSTPPRRVDVYVADSNTRTTLRTQHSKGCGETGEMMYMPLSWLVEGDTEELAREFVQQWSILRYGVFGEDPIDGGSCYRSKDSWNPVGCYDRKKVPGSSPEFEKGLPFCSIDLNDTSSFVHSKSSLMFTSNFSKAMDFCDGSPSLPHDPAMPTLHNSLCKGAATWSVVQNSQDFKFGRNKPLMSPPPAPTFAGFCQNTMQLIFAIQNSTVGKDQTEAVAEIGHSLYQHLLSAKDNTEVSLVMFSDKKDATRPLKLDMASAEKLQEEIVNYVRTLDFVSSNCVSCGFRKALEASKEKGESSTIVVIAWEHTIGDEPPSEILKAIQEQQSSQIIHLVLVENTEADVLSAELIDAIHSTGGQIFYLPEKLVSMASSMHVVLSTIVKSPLQVEDEDDVVHEAVFENITGSFKDSFTTINPEKGTLEYLIHCHPFKIIVPSSMHNCVQTFSTIDTYRCVEELEPNKVKLWEFNLTDKGGTTPPNCSSVAILHNNRLSKEKLTLKGWLSTYTIEPGSEALIVYAEIIGSSADYRVTAEISGPDDFRLSVELRDNGNGDPDVKKGDGIFSRYFMPPSLKRGSYGVKIFAESEITDKFYAYGPRKSKIRRQSKSVGFFSVTKSFPEEDIFPPSRVGDLRAVLYDRDSSTVTLKWTAPGNDYDNGTATSYEIKYSPYASSLSDLYFDSEENTEPTHKTDFTLGESGTTEKTDIVVLSTYDDYSCYIALRAKDANDNRGLVSNVIQIHVDAIIKPTSTELTKLDTTISRSTENVTSAIITSALPTDDPDTTTAPPIGDDDNFFDKKFIITASTAAGILLFIIIINVIVCCCCVNKKRDNPEKSSVRKSTLQPPYNINIAFQKESPEENDREISVTTMGNPSISSERRYSPPQRYIYHTSKSLRGKSRNNNGDQLGFQLVEAMPTTRSLSRFKRRLKDDSDSESDSEPTPAPQQPPNDGHVYSLGIV